jgi:hypothetical protein
LLKFDQADGQRGLCYAHKDTKRTRLFVTPLYRLGEFLGNRYWGTSSKRAMRVAGENRPTPCIVRFAKTHVQRRPGILCAC